MVRLNTPPIEHRRRFADPQAVKHLQRVLLQAPEDDRKAGGVQQLLDVGERPGLLQVAPDGLERGEGFAQLRAIEEEPPREPALVVLPSPRLDLIRQLLTQLCGAVRCGQTAGLLAVNVPPLADPELGFACVPDGGGDPGGPGGIPLQRLEGAHPPDADLPAGRCVVVE